MTVMMTTNQTNKMQIEKPLPPAPLDLKTQVAKAVSAIPDDQLDDAKAWTKEYLRQVLEREPDEQAPPLLPKVPPPGLLMSMALRSDHGLGCPGYYDQQPFKDSPKGNHARRLEATISVMRQLYEEVAGYGFYSPDKEAGYVEMYDAAKEVTNG